MLMVVAACASALLVLGTSRGVGRSVADSPQVLADSPEMQVAHGAFYKGLFQGKFDLPEEKCVEFFKDYLAEDVVVDYTGGPCDFLTGVHKGIPEMCGFFKNMDGRSQVTEVPGDMVSEWQLCLGRSP